MSTSRIGKFTVRAQLRFDNPAWPQYLVFIGEALIGKSFSCPDIGCCQWLEAQEINRIRYANASKPPIGFTIQTKRRQGRPTNAERAARAQAALEAEAVT